MITRKKSVAVASTFGVALSSLYAAPELQADLVAINFNPGSVPWGWTATNFTVGMTAAGLSAAMAVDNNSTWGNNFYAVFGTNAFGLSAMQAVNASSSINPGGVSGNVAAFASSFAGTANVAFSTTGGNVGWFNVTMNGPGNPNIFNVGAFGNAGETVHVGTPAGGAVPEPSSAIGLSLLAFGAAGLRRRKKVTA